jgi:hypothetical protein
MRNQRASQQYHHSIVHVAILVCATTITGGDGMRTLLHNNIRTGDYQRRLHYANINNIVDWISNTDVLTSSQALLVFREEDKQPSDSTTNSGSCKSPSTDWIREQVRNIVSDQDRTNFFEWKVYTLPFVYKLLVEEKGIYDIEYIGPDGKYTQEINSILDKAQSFWSDSGVNIDDIQVLGAHGSDLADLHNKLIPTLEVLYGTTSYVNEDGGDASTIMDHATDIQDLILRLPDGYENPLLTFNAFATDANEYEMNDHPSIIIGDGYFQFQESIGFQSEGPEYAVAHEHAHHLQNTLDASEDRQSARREELMADALSAYFLAHESGLDMMSNEIFNLRQIAYSAGDCETNNDGHHGTPRQRRCATAWGASLSQAEDGTVREELDLFDLKNRFNAWYENVDYLDESCQHHDVIIMAASPASSASYQTVWYTLQALTIFALSFGIATTLP